MKKLVSVLLAISMAVSLCACSADDISDQVVNVMQSTDEHVLSVKGGSPNAYPNQTYGEAFENFFESPTWKYFEGTKEGMDEDGDGSPDYVEENVDIVEFTGYCTYMEVEVKALIQFTLDKNGETFEATYLSFNDVPQNMLILSALLEKAFEENQSQPTTAENEETNEESNEIESDVSTSDGWKDEYLAYLNENGNADYGYSLSFIDEDEVPELVISSPITAEGTIILAYDGKQVIENYVEEYMRYRLQENSFCVSGGRMDYYYDIIYKLVDGEVVEVARGEYGALDYENIIYDEYGDMIYEYSWDGERVSEYEYMTYLEPFNFEEYQGVLFSGGDGYLYDVMEVLSNPTDITIISPYLNDNGYESLLNHCVVIFDGVVNDKIHFNVMHNEQLIASVSATITDPTTAKHKSANSELEIKFDVNYAKLEIEGYINTIDLTGSYFGRWG